MRRLRSRAGRHPLPIVAVLAAVLGVADVAAETGRPAITTGGRSFATWRDYVTSDYFVRGGKRCGKPASVVTAQRAADPSDCTYTLTNPSSDYETIDVYEIPVVVHIIEHTNGDGQISDALVQSQIDVLNEDFRALAGTPGAPGHDVGIQFVLASTDPAGNPTTGITRSVDNTWFNDGGSYWNTLAWDTSRYMNIYTNEAGGNLGYVPDLPQGGLAGDPEDRVVVLWSAFGRNAPIGPPYDQGRTATHEVGHYLGLEHTFNGGCGTTTVPGCYSSGDLICDTAGESTETSGCPGGKTSCGSPDPIDNYLDYSDDTCMDKFTSEQSRRMRCSLLSYRPDVYAVVGTCGNDLREGSEACDGTDPGACPTGVCDPDCTCEDPVCGNDILEAGEECDGLDPGACPTGVCDPDCTCEDPVCGNDVVEAGEACDGTDPGACPTGVCDPDCTCEDPVCGNDVVEAGEACDGTDDTACPGLCLPPLDPSECECAGDEPNETVGTATAITCPSTALGKEIGPQGDVDFYAFSATVGQTIGIDVDADQQGSALDPVLGFFDGPGTPLQTSDDDPAPGEPGTFDPYLSVVVPHTGTFYVAVSAYSDFDFDGGGDAGSIGPYDLILTGCAPVPTPTPTSTRTPRPTCTPGAPVATPTPLSDTGVKCQREISKETSKFVKTKVKLLQRCLDRIVKGAIGDPGPGSRTAFCLGEPVTAFKIAQAESKIAARIARRCGGGDRTCNLADEEPPDALGFYGVCPDLESTGGDCAIAITTCADIAACLRCIGTAAVEQAVDLYYEALSLAPSGTDLNKCQRAIGKEAAKFLLAKDNELRKCWDRALKGKHGDRCPDAAAPAGSAARKAAERIAKAESKKVTRICKACGGGDRQCDAVVPPVSPLAPALGGSAGGDDLGPAAIGFPAACADVKVPHGGPFCDATVSTLADLVHCVDCLTEFKVDCVDAARMPALAGRVYPCECNP